MTGNEKQNLSMVMRIRRYADGCCSALLLMISLLVLSGCASISGPPDPHDPFERYNRAMFNFNDSVDKAVIRPVAEGYVKVVPAPVRSGVSNFFSNLDDVLVLINDVLQLKVTQAAAATARILVNSTIGIFGIFDVATSMGVSKHDEDFGQTLGHWGVGSGPYLVLPFFGPSSPRDGLGRYVDSREFDPLPRHVDENAVRNGLRVVSIVDTRARLLRASRLLETASLDPYVFIRDAYLQRRRNLVYDGNPPEEEFEDVEGGDVEQGDVNPQR